jgi:unsaturated pyranuronate lyase
MLFFDYDELPEKEIVPGIRFRSVYLENLMLTMVRLDPDAVLPEHSHPHEQITYCISGSLELTVAGEPYSLSAGKGVKVPANAVHSGLTGPEGAFVTDSWSPIREDYVIDKD